MNSQRSLRTTLTAVLAAGTLALAGCASEVGGDASAVSSDLSHSAVVESTDSGAAGQTSDGTDTEESSESSSPAVTDTTDADPSASDGPDTSASGDADASESDDASESADAGASSESGSDSDVAAFAAAMQQGIADVTSVTATMDMKAAGMGINATIAQKLDKGTTTAFDMQMDMGTFKLHILQVDGTSYIGPASTLKQMNVDSGGKPWVELGDDSSNPILSQMAGQMDQTASQSGPGQYAEMVSAATGIDNLGAEKVDGVKATHFKLTIDVSKLEGVDSSSLAAALQAGVSEIPLDVWLDGDNRPVKIVEDFAIQGQTINMTVSMGNYNKPLTIKAPAAKDVAKG